MTSPKHKRCPKCDKYLDRSLFDHRSGKDSKYLRSRCRDCEREYAAGHRDKQVLEGTRPAPKFTKIGLTDAERARRRKSNKMKNRYGIDLKDYEEMLASQQNKCFVCPTVHEEGLPLHVDHCHDTGIVRGLLCQKCNWALGMTNDNTDTLRGLIDYINLYKE